MKPSIRNVKRLWKSRILPLILLVLSQAILTEKTLASEELYMKYCMSCHADDGSGEMPGVCSKKKPLIWVVDQKTLKLVFE
jgi:hypothetical protein